MILHAPEIRPTTPPLEKTFTLPDGTALFYRHWEPAIPSKKALFLFHRGHEHSGRFAHLVDELGLTDFHIFAWDARGHGKSPGERGYAPSVCAIIKDIDDFVRFISVDCDLPIENMVILGHSVAAVLVSAWVHDYAPPIRAMVLATPALRIKLYIPFAMPGLRAIAALRGKAFIKSYVKARMLTHDPEMAREYAADPLISRQIAVNILLDLHDLSTRMLDDAGAIQTPTLLLSAGNDWVVKNSAQAKFFQRLGSTDKQMHFYPGFFHAIFHEKERTLVVSAVREFIARNFRQPAESHSLLDADKAGFTKREYDRLATPLPIWRPSRLSFAIQKLTLKTIASLSDGIRLGWRTGFDSGQSLDYVYENQPRGKTPLGKLIDRFYLNSVGWRGIRVRKANIEQALADAAARVRSAGQTPRFLDIAAGPGRYLLDALKNLPPGQWSALLRDRNRDALAQGRARAAEMGMTNVTYEEGDAFNADALAAVTPRPNIAIVSGLYELFPDNAMVLASLTGLSRALADGGYLIYTNQPWHPQIEMIARVLINRDQKPWIMRRRTQGEMDELVRSVGFEKIAMYVDQFGIFTVSIARWAGLAGKVGRKDEEVK
ncbi:MAG TPA: bifunctional alpha/beta hydrolase/class I SAM-dependent methyltransferase [Tepidisphaeraceae bacterium]|jgi:alpha-beta hydrolase superfamily lysophospholipase/SAM-dependent methyltransferase|nr:bifunctional alpha/beta hydrolase/class I SAM-dependent methyltransferase [Tepidisphaeraceae bacterium]